ncbi:hypothetical protein [Deinococcus yavapaiensis]|uniref:YD repeat-containing protein n=1 Tax=Deinococcus yavapaiensis KR-236 TaxID=694435 RepID=A0A318S4G1_9DEIO|nr:hypothetical protein [Deinococcus yavapaiensis]PYE51860.1 hypothetical protein DES52_11461 [Deinococcus yavapaiensis KR-236]
MNQRSVLLVGVALSLAACSSPRTNASVGSSILGNLDRPREVSFHVTTMTRRVDPFDEQHHLRTAASIQDDTKMTYAYDDRGRAETVRIDPYEASGQEANTAYLLDFARNTVQTLDKKTAVRQQAFTGARDVLKSLAGDVSLQSNPLVPPKLQTFRGQSASGFHVLATDRTGVVTLRRAQQTPRGQVVTSLTFDATSELLEGIETRTENPDLVNTTVQDITYQTIDGHKIVDEVTSRTTIEMKDKHVFGELTLPNAAVLGANEAPTLQPGERVVGTFTTPLHPGRNDTSVYAYETTTDYSDVHVR